MSNRVDPDETAHDEPSHLDLLCLQKPNIIVYGSERVVKTVEYMDVQQRIVQLCWQIWIITVRICLEDTFSRGPHL